MSTSLVAAMPAAAQWTAIRLHPAGAIDSLVHTVWGPRQGGGLTPSGPPANYRPALWSGSPGSLLSLGTGFGEIYGMDGAHEVGQYQGGAVTWAGTPESRISLHPAGATGASLAYAVSGDQQVGRSGWGAPSPGNDHASLWRGSAASFVDLHPVGAGRSIAYATDGTLQGGMVEVPATHAALWSGTAASFVDLNPGPGFTSTILGMVPGQQVGWARPLNSQHAAIWSGTAASWQDLHPFPGTGSSFLQATNGQIQVGYSHVPSSSVPHAGAWYGTAASFIDLHQFLPPGYSSSGAYAIYQDASGITIGGNAVNSMGRSEAFIWTTVPSPAAAGLLAAWLLAPRRRRHARSSRDGR